MKNVNVTVASEIELSPEVHAAKDKISEAIGFAFNTISDHNPPDAGELFDIILLMTAAFFTASSPLKEEDLDLIANRFRKALAHQNGSTTPATEKH